MKPPKSEADIKKRLFKRVKEVGGLVRKVRWEGRSKAPDTVIMLPEFIHPVHAHYNREASTTWAELKTPGGAAIFPKNAHEEAQAREHVRMREAGQHVVVIDSYEQIEEILR